MKRKILLGALFALAAAVLALLWALDLGSWARLDMDRLTRLSQNTIMYDAHDQPVAALSGGENRVLVSIDEVPEHVKNAFVAIEDARFYSHKGVDIWRIGGALVSNLRAGGYREGGSTITQQLIKLTHLTSEKSLSRKAQEAWLALQLERRASKDEILEMYLNAVYFGRGAYGIEAAAQSYFGKSVGELTLAEGALLAGVIKAPSAYGPQAGEEKTLRRRAQVLNAMVREGMISKEEAEAADQDVPALAQKGDMAASGWYADWVLKEAEDALGCDAEEILGGGYRIYTAVEMDMQRAAEAAFEEGGLFPGGAGDGALPESALIAVDVESGEIRCMVGGRKYDTLRGLNRAMQIRRQPGSAFKPISVYAAAVDLLGYTPISLVEDEPRDFGGGYTPSNAGGTANGTVTLRQALVRSMNLATVDLMTRVGVDAARLYAQRAGVHLADADANLSLALGALTQGVSPGQLAAAYAPLVNGGHSVSPHAIRRIEDLYGRVVYAPENEKGYVMGEKSARMITSMLEEAAQSGTARALAGIGYPVAAKTGTVGETNGGNRDAWLAAYTPRIALAVWMGYDQPDKNHMLPAGATGGAYPARLAAQFMKSARAYCDGGEFSLPGGMAETLIDAAALMDRKTPMLASENTPSEYLLRELLPVEKTPVVTSDLWEEPKRVDMLYVQSGAQGYPEISFIAPDSRAVYRVMRVKNGETEEVGTVEGGAGSYLSFSDRAPGHDSDAEYFVVSRHRGFMEQGRIVESEPSERVSYRAPQWLERWMRGWETPQTTETEDAIFGENAYAQAEEAAETAAE